MNRRTRARCAERSYCRKTAPAGWADFFDTKKFPGKRSLRNGAKWNLEVALIADGVPAKDLKAMADDIKKQIGSGVVALVSSADGKASLVVGVNLVADGIQSAFDA